MRFHTTIILLFGALIAGTCGCRSNTTLRCERETALLRAEILDLEDKYYALKSEYQTAVQGGGSGTIITDGVVGSGLIGSSPIVVGSSPVIVNSVPMVQGEVIQGDVIYEDQMIHGSVVPGTVIPGTVNSVPTIATPVEGGVYYESSPTLSQPTINQGVSPTPAATGSGSPNLQTPAIDNSTSDNDQTLMLPDDPELEVGYEDLELDLGSGEVDRLEIVSSATRGKDLDGVPGHDGIELLIRTVNANGDFVERNGELTITVKDQLAGEIGKWTFLPEELKLFLSRDELGNMGTLLHLPWTGKIPVSKQVEIRVSMMIQDMEYIATLNLDIEPPTGQSDSPAIVGWAVDDDRWVSASTTSQPRIRSAPSSRTIQRQPPIERPVWKPVR